MNVINDTDERMPYQDERKANFTDSDNTIGNDDNDEKMTDSNDFVDDEIQYDVDDDSSTLVAASRSDEASYNTNFNNNNEKNEEYEVQRGDDDEEEDARVDQQPVSGKYAESMQDDDDDEGEESHSHFDNSSDSSSDSSSEDSDNDDTSTSVEAWEPYQKAKIKLDSSSVLGSMVDDETQHTTENELVQALASGNFTPSSGAAKTTEASISSGVATAAVESFTGPSTIISTPFTAIQQQPQQRKRKSSTNPIDELIEEIEQQAAVVSTSTEEPMKVYSEEQQGIVGDRELTNVKIKAPAFPVLSSSSFPQVFKKADEVNKEAQELLQSSYQKATKIKKFFDVMASQQRTTKSSFVDVLAAILKTLENLSTIDDDITLAQLVENKPASGLCMALKIYLRELLSHIQGNAQLANLLQHYLRSTAYMASSSKRQKILKEISVTIQRLPSTSSSGDLAGSSELVVEMVDNDVRVRNPQSVFVFLASLLNNPLPMLKKQFDTLGSQAGKFTIDPVFLQFFEGLSISQQFQFMIFADAMSRYEKIVQPLVNRRKASINVDEEGESESESNDDDDDVMEKISKSEYLLPTRNDIEDLMVGFQQLVMNPEYIVKVMCSSDLLLHDIIASGDFLSLSEDDRKYYMALESQLGVLKSLPEDALVKIVDFVQKQYQVRLPTTAEDLVALKNAQSTTDLERQLIDCVLRSAKELSRISLELKTTDDFDEAYNETVLLSLETLMIKLIKKDYRQALDDKVLALAIRYVSDKDKINVRQVQNTFVTYNIDPRSVVSVDLVSLLERLSTTWLENRDNLQAQVDGFDVYMKNKYGDKLKEVFYEQLLDNLDNYYNSSFEKENHAMSMNTRDFLRLYLRLYRNLEKLPSRTDRTFTKLTEIEDFPSFLVQSFSDYSKNVSKQVEYQQAFQSMTPSYGVIAQLNQYINALLDETASRTSSNALQQSLVNSLMGLHLSSFIDVPKLMNDANLGKTKALYEALELVGVFSASGEDEANKLIALMQKGGSQGKAAITKVQDILNKYSKSENLRLVRKLKEQDYLPIYRALAVYYRQPMNVSKAITKVDPFTTDKHFTKRRLRTELYASPEQQIARRVQKLNVNETDLDLYQTKPWMKLSNDYTWFVRPVHNARVVPKDKLGKQDFRRTFFGANKSIYPNTYIYEPTAEFWKWYANKAESKQVDSTKKVRDFNDDCMPSEKFLSYFVGPQRSFDLGLYNVLENKMIMITKSDLIAECNYMNRHLHPLHVKVSALKHSTDMKMSLKQVEAKMRSEVETVLSNLKRTLPLYKMVDVVHVAKKIVDVFIQYALDHYFSIGELLKQFFQFLFVLEQPVGNLLQLEVFKSQSNLDMLPTMSLIDMLPSLLFANLNVQSNVKSIIEAESVNRSLEFLAALEYLTKQSAGYISSILELNRLGLKKVHDVFASSYKNQYKNLCANKVEGPIVFYYTSTDDRSLMCAGFEEINRIITASSENADTLGVPGLSDVAIRHIRSKFNANNDFSTLLKEVKQQLQSVDVMNREFIRAAEYWNQLKKDTFVNRLDLQDAKLQAFYNVIVNKFKITDPVLANLAADHLATTIQNRLMNSVLQVLDNLNRVWPMYSKFEEDYKREAEERSIKYGTVCASAVTDVNDKTSMDRCRIEQQRVSSNDRAQRKALLQKKFHNMSLVDLLKNQIEWFGEFMNDSVLNQVVDYLTIKLNLPNVKIPEGILLCQGSDCVQVRAQMSTYKLHPGGFERIDTCSDIGCITELLGEDKFPPISSRDIQTSEFFTNVSVLLEPYYSINEIAELAKKFNVQLSEVEASDGGDWQNAVRLWHKLVLLFDVNIYDDLFLKGNDKKNAIRLLYKRLIAEDDDGSSTKTKLQNLLINEKFQGVVEQYLASLNKKPVDIMNLLESLVAPWSHPNLYDRRSVMFADEIRGYIKKDELSKFPPNSSSKQLFHYLLSKSFRDWNDKTKENTKRRYRMPGNVLLNRENIIRDLYQEFMLRLASSQDAYENNLNLLKRQEQEEARLRESFSSDEKSADFVRKLDEMKMRHVNDLLDALFKQSTKFEEAFAKKLVLPSDEVKPVEEQQQPTKVIVSKVTEQSAFLPLCKELTNQRVQQWIDEYVNQRWFKGQVLETLLDESSQSNVTSDAFHALFEFTLKDGRVTGTNFDFLKVVEMFSQDFPTEPCVRFSKAMLQTERAYRQVMQLFHILGVVTFGVVQKSGPQRSWQPVLDVMYSNKSKVDDVFKIVLYYLECFGGFLPASDIDDRSSETQVNQSNALHVERIGTNVAQIFQSTGKFEKWDKSMRWDNPALWQVPENIYMKMQEQHITRMIDIDLRTKTQAQQLSKSYSYEPLVALLKSANIPYERLASIEAQSMKEEKERTVEDTIQLQSERAALERDLLMHFERTYDAEQAKLIAKTNERYSELYASLQLLKPWRVQSKMFHLFCGAERERQHLIDGYKIKMSAAHANRLRSERDMKVYNSAVEDYYKALYSFSVPIVLFYMGSKRGMEDLKFNVLSLQSQVKQLAARKLKDEASTLWGKKYGVEHLDFLQDELRRTYKKQTEVAEASQVVRDEFAPMFYVPSYSTFIGFTWSAQQTNSVELIEKLFSMFVGKLQAMLPMLVSSSLVSRSRLLKTFVRDLQDKLSKETDGAIQSGCVIRRYEDRTAVDKKTLKATTVTSVVPVAKFKYDLDLPESVPEEYEVKSGNLGSMSKQQKLQHVRALMKKQSKPGTTTITKDQPLVAEAKSDEAQVQELIQSLKQIKYSDSERHLKNPLCVVASEESVRESRLAGEEFDTEDVQMDDEYGDVPAEDASEEEEASSDAKKAAKSASTKEQERYEEELSALIEPVTLSKDVEEGKADLDFARLQEVDTNPAEDVYRDVEMGDVAAQDDLDIQRGDDDDDDDDDDDGSSEQTKEQEPEEARETTIKFAEKDEVREFAKN